MPDTLKFHFMLEVTKHQYVLIENPGPVGHAGPVTVVQSWPQKGYSREKALNRADRFVGEACRRADAGTFIVYTQALPFTTSQE